MQYIQSRKVSFITVDRYVFPEAVFRLVNQKILLIYRQPARALDFLTFSSSAAGHEFVTISWYRLIFS